MFNQIIFQDAASAVIERIIIFYDYSIIIIIIIIIFIIYFIIFIIKNNLVNRFILEGQLIEIIWTLIPIGFLLFLAIPSLKILYLSDEIIKPLLRIKVIGHQWFWEYEYIFKLNLSKIKIFNYESLIKLIDFDKLDQFRLLDVSKNLYIPLNRQIRLIILSDDVIHSFTVPALGVKVDAVPGRLNQINLFVNRPGIYYGQCSEICGVNHRFIPIVVETIRLTKFLLNLINQNE